jgi:hypothetical protein
MNAALLITRNQLPFYCGSRDGGAFDFSRACPTCGTGARRVDPITLPLRRLKEKVSCTLKLEIVLPPRLVPVLMAVAPNCLRVVRDAITGKDTGYYELVPETVLPRWRAETSGWMLSEMDPQCDICKRDGYFHVPKQPLRLCYNCPPSEFCVAETYEHFGKSQLKADFPSSLLACPLLIVSEAIQAILAGEPGVEFVPVIFVRANMRNRSIASLSQRPP